MENHEYPYALKTEFYVRFSPELGLNPKVRRYKVLGYGKYLCHLREYHEREVIFLEDMCSPGSNIPVTLEYLDRKVCSSGKAYGILTDEDLLKCYKEDVLYILEKDKYELLKSYPKELLEETINGI